MPPRRPSEQPRLLVITNVLPSQRASAGEQRLIRLCQLLRERCHVRIVGLTALTREESRLRTETLERLGVGVVAQRVGSGSGLREVLIRHRFDGVLFEFWHVASDTIAAVRRWQPRARIVVDTVDLEFVRDERGSEFAYGRPSDAVAIRKERELATYGMADALVFVSTEEQRLYRSLRSLPTRSWVVPIIVSLRSRLPGPRPPVVLFVGNFWHAPNVDGIVWFAREVWPHVRATIPEATLKVVGSNVWDEITRLSDLDGVHVVGFVENLDAAYDEAAVVVAPLRWGAGMKGKVCEAMACAVPLVTTRLGLEGLDVRPGVDLEVADEPHEMARSVIAMLSDQDAAERIGASGQAAIAAHCQPEVIEPVIADVIAFVAGGRDRSAPRSWWLSAVADESSSTARHLLRLLWTGSRIRRR